METINTDINSSIIDNLFIVIILIVILIIYIFIYVKYNINSINSINSINILQSTNIKRYGTEYGGFYYPEGLDLLNKDSIIYSFGVGLDISHDLMISNQLNSHIYLFDPTIESKYHVDYIKDILDNKSPILSNKKYGGGDPNYLDICLENKIDTNKIHYYDYGIYKNCDRLKFYKPKNKEYVSCSLNKKMNNININNFYYVYVKDLKTIMYENNHTNIDLLKIDVEGVECDIVDYLIDNNIYPIYLSIDFDTIHIDKERVYNSLDKLKKYYHLIHTNGQDYSFIIK